MSENWFFWWKHLHCSIFSTPCITDAMGTFVFIFSHWTTVDYNNLNSEIQRIEWQGYIMMYLTKNCLPFLNCRAVSIFKVLSITKLENIFLSLKGIGKPFHYWLSISFYCCLCTEFSNTCPHIFIIINIVLYIYIVYFGKRKWYSKFIVFI